MLTAESLDFFSDFGFVVVEDYFLSEELSDFKDALTKIIRARIEAAGLFVETGLEIDEGILALEKAHHQHVAEIYDTIPLTPEFSRIVGKRETAETICQLLGVPPRSPLYGFQNRCRIDPPQDDRRTYGWHQEVFYTIPESRFIQTWSPLIRSTTALNGTISVCRGSHKEGIARCSWIESEGRATQIIVDDDVVAKYEPVQLEMPLGAMLFFSGQTFHRSGNNTSREVRYSLVGMYHDASFSAFHPARISFDYDKTPKQYFEEMKLG